jgi:hypothetical protein
MSILALTSNTLVGTPGAGQIEYDGQFFGTDSNASRAQLQRIVRATAVASTSGTSIDFTDLPSWIKRITVMISGVSTSGTSIVQIQLGSGSVTTTGYNANASFGPSAGQYGTATTGFVIEPSASATAATVRYSSVIFSLLSANTWVSQGNLYTTATTANITNVGQISLSGVLDRVRITTVNGTDAFDAGSINIMYEG